MNENTTSTGTTCFVPQFLLAASLAILLGWQVLAAVHQHSALEAMSEKQTVMVNQAVQVEGKMQAMMTDLMRLSVTDAEAKAIITKYRITYTPPRQPGIMSEPAQNQLEPSVTGQNQPMKAASPDKNANRK